MGLHVGSTVINTPDLEGSIAFWTAALGYVVRSADIGFIVMAAPDGTEFCVVQSAYRQE